MFASSFLGISCLILLDSCTELSCRFSKLLETNGFRSSSRIRLLASSSDMTKVVGFVQLFQVCWLFAGRSVVPAGLSLECFQDQ